MQLAIRAAQWIFRWIVIFGLALLLAIGLLCAAYGVLEVLAYYWFSKEAHQYPVNLESVFWALKLLAVYLVSTWLLSQYRSSSTNQVIVKRSVIVGLVIGSLLIGALALDRFVMHYYSSKIDCKLPGPVQKPICK